ncbi:RNA 2'-phosphotransferase [Naumannella halotolerans]|uniref:RNA 2'-phosphotransferase n=1 Tax=Naumannella halotolerans TaxID=993414 RepID=UPI001AAFE29B|nr:RNA 2'-phosphotransferase [Naumannella halotolerans]
MTVGDVDLSRAASHAFRHEPWVYELELDEEGWVPVDQLLAALNEKGGAWRSVGRPALRQMLRSATKRRHELRDDRIRALYGHSVPGRIQREEAAPPGLLFHGTAPETWRQLQINGLLPMGRQFVHLSVDRETAASVGGERVPIRSFFPLAPAAVLSGAKVYQGNELVWLADAVSAQFILPTT